MKSKILIGLFIATVFFAALSANPFVTRKTKLSYSAPVATGRLPNWLVTAQQGVRENMSVIFKDIKTGKGVSAYLLLVMLAFFYGLLHAAGPGHRKSIVFSLFISKRAEWWEPLYAGFLLAVLHAFMSVFLILAIKLAAGRVLSLFVEQAAVYLELASYILLLLIAVTLVGYKIYNVLRHKKHQHHLPQGKGLYSTIIISGLVPCPGATIIMIFAVTLNMVWQGILAVTAMSVGMGLTISLAGYLAFFSKETLFVSLKSREELIEKIGFFLEIAGLLMVLLFALYMLYPLLLK